MKITVELDDEKLEEIISKEVAKNIVRDSYYIDKKVIGEIVREVVYSRKEELINRAVDKAAAELTRKGLSKLLDEIKK